ncbi:MAG: chemotaxis protein CheV [Gammaproteobacteria bacterium]|nr:chemotaxis protein CheV [Gammaproteobacteria bacterium]
MAGVLDTVDMRTQLAGRNRLELLMFRLGGRQLYGINVFKVQEVIRCPALNNLPQAHPVIKGVAHLRGKTISIIDLRMAINHRALPDSDESFVIITEYNRFTQGFLVNSVDRIININWSEVMPPPKASGKNSYLTAVTKVADEMVEIIDVEKVFSEIMGVNEEVAADIIDQAEKTEADTTQHVLVVDDSSVARNQIKRLLDKVGIACTVANDGQEGLDILKEWAKDDIPVEQRINLVISDIEMPRMDGYTLTTEIRKDPRLDKLYVLLHTSLSGVFNKSMVEKVGANNFVPKFNPDELAKTILTILETKKLVI